jgi:outer membrane protein assembly factor BamB
MKTLLFVLVPIVAFALPEPNQWRGPQRDGIFPATGLLREWPKEGPKLAWQIEGLGQGLSSVAIGGGKLFTISQRKGGQFVVAFDLASRKEVWAAKISDNDDSPNGTPTIDDGQVFAVSKDGKMLCCAAADGREQWRKDFAADFGGKMMSGWGYSESPLVDGDQVIVTPGGKEALLVALDRKTGQTRWKAAQPDRIGSRGEDGAGYTGAVISNAVGFRQYVTLVGRGVVSVQASDGKILWAYNRIANGTANIPTPLAWDDYVFTSTGYGTGAALLKVTRADAAKTTEPAPVSGAEKIAGHQKKLADLNAEITRRREARAKTQEGSPEYDKANEAVQSIKPDIATAERELAKARGTPDVVEGPKAISGSPLAIEEVYFLEAGAFQNHHGGMVRIGDHIYAGKGHNNGFPICLEWKTGKPTWDKGRGPGKESAAVIAADGFLYFRYQDGTMALIEATPSGYSEKGSFKLPHVDGPAWSHPVIHGGQLFIRDQDALMCYDLRPR